MKLLGTPHAVFLDDGACSEDPLAVPATCSDCRQVARWMPKTLSWTKTKTSRLYAIMRAILRSHDDILASFCGNCFLQETLDRPCECGVSFFESMGGSLVIKEYTYDPCMTLGNKKTIVDSCGVSECWFEICDVQFCETCAEVTLDPCNNTEHAAIYARLNRLLLFKLNANKSGPALLAAIDLLFPGASPRIITNEIGLVQVGLARRFTATEAKLRKHFISLLPVAQGVTVIILEPCEA